MESELFKPIIEVEDVVKVFGQGDVKVEALRGITLKVFKGEFIIIFGPSGSGKSTLLNVISGLDSVTSGKVYVDGVDLSSLSSGEKARFHRDKVGIVFQAYNLIPTLTIRQNIALPLVFAGVDHEERRARANKLLEEFQLSSLANRLPAEASGGQQQRVGIMRALVGNPPILIADEPTGNLDSRTSKEVMQVFRNLNRNLGVTVVVVTHDPTQFPWADRVVHVLDGKIIKQTIYHQKPFYSAFTEVLEQKLGEGVDDGVLFPSSGVGASTTGEEVGQDIPDETLIATTGGLKGVAESEVKKEEEKGEGTEAEGTRIVVLTGFEALWENRARLGVENEHILTMLVATVGKRLLDRYTQEQLLDLIQIIRMRIHNEVTKRELHDYLDRSITDGGIGLHSATAQKLTDMVEGMVTLFGYHPHHKRSSKEVKKETVDPFDYLWFARTHFDKESEILMRIVRDWLTEYQLEHLEKDQLLNLLQISRERMAGVVQSDEIYDLLHQSVSSGGVGLYKQTAKRLADNLNALVDLFEILRHMKRLHKEGAPPLTGYERVLLRRMHLDPRNERILMMLGYLLNSKQKARYTQEQILSIVQLIRYRIEGVITAEEFRKYLDDSRVGGGAGLYKQVAKRLSAEVERMIDLFKEGK